VIVPQTPYESLDDMVKGRGNSMTRMALQANDDLVQGLTAAKMALELSDLEMARRAIDVTLVAAKAIVTDLLALVPQRELDLTRATPALR